jgi:polyisoprenoid-binding protein YceI
MFALTIGLITLTACGTKPAPEVVNEPILNTPVLSNQVIENNSNLTGIYNVNLAESKLAWKASKVTASHTGLVKIKSGTLELNNNNLVSGSFVIDMPTISSDENMDSLVKHLNSADFFATEMYPEAKLEIKSAAANGNPNEYLVTADLTIKDVTAPINFTAKTTSFENNLEAVADFSIDRTVWGIKYGSGQFFQDLGDKMIDDQINFQINLKASK